MKTVNKKLPKKLSVGSALILTVVLTSLLAIVGVLFVMVTRVDKIATSAISENRELDFAIETVIAKISQELVADTPGVAGQGYPWEEYYDYPDVNNPWLANLEPYEFGPGDYRWRQISDIYNQLGASAWNLQAGIVPDYQDPCDMIEGRFADADADGDGVADSRWVIIPEVTSNKGEPVFAAIRVVDNEAMLNVNTGYKFDPNIVDPNSNFNLLDGSSQLQINLARLSQRGANGGLKDAADKLQTWRCGAEPNDLLLYNKNVVWRYNNPAGAYTPFDISDELELRYRFLLNHRDIDTRVEEVWDNVFQVGKQVPYDSGILDWPQKAQYGIMADPNDYSYRHLATIYNMDRIIDPNGDKMVNINKVTSVDKYELYSRLLCRIEPNKVDPIIGRRLAQLAVNIIDFTDDDDDDNDGVLDANSVTTLVDPYDPNIIYYGFEAQPFITEIAIIPPVIAQEPDKSKPPILPDPAVGSYAIELYNPFDVDIPLTEFELELVSTFAPLARIITFVPGDVIRRNSCLVISNDPSVFVDTADPNVDVILHPELILLIPPEPDKSKPPVLFEQSYYGYDVFLKRFVSPGGPIYVDRQLIPTINPSITPQLYLSRDVRDWHVVYQEASPAPASLGLRNIFVDPNISGVYHNFSFFLPNPLRPRARFVTVGDIPRILTIGHGPWPNSTIGEQLWGTPKNEEYNIRLDLQNPYHRNIFQYLTVFDPSSDDIDNDGDGDKDELYDRSEWKIPGRININTAPWYVIAQLPWASDRRPLLPLLTHDLAKEIVRYRDMGAGGFESIGELNFVGLADPNVLRRIDFYARGDGPAVGDQIGFPDLTTDGPGLGDGVADDFEERDVIFSRISNLVSVRSDVFTAYMLVRIGADGPQKRAIAIFDRSNVFSDDGKVKIVALHYVPDPR